MNMNQSCMCGACGGLKMQPGVSYGYAGKVCYCVDHRPQQQYYQQIQQHGWECSRCKKIHAPFVIGCVCKVTT